MTADQVQKRISAIPYRPFDLCLADSRAVHVDHPDLLAFDRGKRVVIVYSSDGMVEVIDLMLVLSIRFHEPEFLHSDSSTGENPTETP
jgi:hypothetical protein